MSRSKAVSSQNHGDPREDGRIQVIYAVNSRLADLVTLMTQAEQEYWDVKREFENLAHQVEEGSRLKSKEDLLAAVPAEVNGDPEFLKTDPQTKERRDHGLDNTLSETFPCSDPLSSIPNPVSFPADLESARRLRTPIFPEIYNCSLVTEGDGLTFRAQRRTLLGKARPAGFIECLSHLGLKSAAGSSE